MFTQYSDAANAQALSGAQPADPIGQPLAQARSQQDRYFQSLQSGGTSVPFCDDFIVPGPHGGIPVRLLKPLTDEAPRVLVFLRGAGFWAGGLDSHARTTHTLANLSQCAVCAIDYRRTPEHAWPVQRDEVLGVLEWLRRNTDGLGIAAGAPVLFGESAGATLALSVAMRLRDGGRGSALSGLVLFYNNAGGPRDTARPYSRWVWQQYLGKADPFAVPGPVPMIQTMSGLPPMWLGCGDADPLLSDTKELSRRLEDAGVPHTVTLYAGMPHAFLMHSGTLQPAMDALADAAAAARHFFFPNACQKDSQ